MALRYILFNGSDGESLNAVGPDGKAYAATQDHPRFNEIVERLRADDESAFSLFDLTAAVDERFRKVSGRVSVKGGRVYFDNEVVDNSLTQQVVRMIEQDADFGPVVAFYERLRTNENPHSVEQLYRWLRVHNFSITGDGMIIGYKAVHRSADDTLVSDRSGNAIADGIQYTNKQIPNVPGTIVEMPRGDVTFDSHIGCSVGLHVGTWGYASTFGPSVTLMVVVDPRDVVSVPTDASDQKLRVCRYYVEGIVTEPYTEALLALDNEGLERYARSTYGEAGYVPPSYSPDYEDEDPFDDDEYDEFDDEEDDDDDCGDPDCYICESRRDSYRWGY